MVLGKTLLPHFNSLLLVIISDLMEMMSQNHHGLTTRIGFYLAGLLFLGSLCSANDETLGILKGGFKSFQHVTKSKDLWIQNFRWIVARL